MDINIVIRSFAIAIVLVLIIRMVQTFLLKRRIQKAQECWLSKISQQIAAEMVEKLSRESKAESLGSPTAVYSAELDENGLPTNYKFIETIYNFPKHDPKVYGLAEEEKEPKND